jgi:hypothetical protein
VSDAEATVEFAILNGLAEKHGSPPEVVVAAIKTSIFSASTAWAVAAYLHELEARRGPRDAD